MSSDASKPLDEVVVALVVLGEVTKDTAGHHVFYHVTSGVIHSIQTRVRELGSLRSGTRHLARGISAVVAVL